MADENKKIGQPGYVSIAERGKRARENNQKLKEAFEAIMKRLSPAEQIVVDNYIKAIEYGAKHSTNQFLS